MYKFKAKNTILKCINSRVKQTYKNIEIIIIDDGSTDSTLNKLNDLAKNDDRIIIKKQRNSGVSVARNNGINIASGDYILFVDSDDWLEKTMIEKMIITAQKENTDIVRCNFYDEYVNKTLLGKIYDELKNIKILNSEYALKNIYDYFLTANKPIKNFVMLILIKKELILKNKIYFNEKLYMLEDVLFYQELLYYSKSIYFLDEPLYHYYENPNSVTYSRKQYERMIYGIIDSNKEIVSFLINKNIVSKEYIKHINGNHFRIIILYLFYIWNELGNMQLKKNLIDLYKNKQFNIIINNYDNYGISYMFGLLMKSIKNKKTNILKILL